MATGVLRRASLDNTDPETSCAPQAEPLPLPGDDAKASMHYPGKATEREILEPRHRRFLRMGRLDSDSGAGTGAGAIEPNALVWGDNFHVLNRLLDTHAGKVDLVYLDPPYCTGFEFHSRALAHAYRDQLSPVAYLELMRRRLILLRELLAAHGSLYLHIGHQMVFHLKVVLDEVFGPGNFRNMVVRRKCSSKNYTRRQYPNLHDYILFYSKSDDYKWNRPTQTPTAGWLAKEYPKSDAKGHYKLVPVHAPGVRNGASGQPWRGVMPPPGKHWQYTPEKLDELDRNGEIHWSRTGNPRRKVYLAENKGIALTDYWADFRDAHHQSIPITGYPTEKNLEMLRTIVRAASDAGDLVIDPFCGSGTTLHAANDLGRRWIGIDASRVAIDAAANRLCNGLTPMGDYVVRNTGSASKAAAPAAPVNAAFDLIGDAEWVARSEEPGGFAPV